MQGKHGGPRGGDHTHGKLSEARHRGDSRGPTTIQQGHALTAQGKRADGWEPLYEGRKRYMQPAE